MTDIRQDGAQAVPSVPSAPPALVAPPEFAEPSLSKVRPSAPQLAVQAIASKAFVAPASAAPVASVAATGPALALGPAPVSGPTLASGPAPVSGLTLALSPALPPTSALEHELALAAAGSLRSRVPAFAVMKECLRVQSSAPERTALARVFGREPLHPDALSWYRGAVGELQVARVLGKLDPRWTVLHAVPVGSAGADIDHVLIGPCGTFTINTKNHGGKKVWAAGTTFVVNGQKLAHIHHSTFEAQRAARLLTDVTGTPVSVTPLIVLVDPASLTRKKPDVTVLDATEILRWIRRQPQMQTDATVARITWAAARRDTWTTLVDEDAVPAKSRGHAEGDYEQQFAALQAEVDAAQARRRAWSLLGALAFLTGVVGATLLLAPFIPEIVSKLIGGA